MRLTGNISRGVSGLLFMLFLLAIAPKRLLHDLFAEHQEHKCYKQRADNQQPSFNTGGIHCDCDQLVAQSPFTAIYICPFFEPIPYHSQQATTISENWNVFKIGDQQLRGPPTVS